MLPHNFFQLITFPNPLSGILELTTKTSLTSRFHIKLHGVGVNDTTEPMCK